MERIVILIPAEIKLKIIRYCDSKGKGIGQVCREALYKHIGIKAKANHKPGRK